MNKTAIIVALVGSIPLTIIGIIYYVLRGLAMKRKS